MGSTPAAQPVLLLLVGSDLSMMKALNDCRRPFHQRGTELVLGPLGPADLAEMLDLDAATAFDAALITGGLPLAARDWQPGATVWACGRSSTSPAPPEA